MRSYGLIVSIRKVLAVLVALSVLFAPSAAAAAEHAMSMAGHDTAMTKMHHCKTAPKSHSQHKMSGDSCCISMSAAAAVAPTEAFGSLEPAKQVVQFARAPIYHGLLTEIATPPPRIA